MDFIAETNQTNGIALFQRNIAEHQDCIECMVKHVETSRHSRHQSPAIEHEDDSLALAGLEILDRQLASSSRRTPVDVFVVVVRSIVAKPFEFVVLSDLSGSTNTCLLYTSPSPRDLSTSRMPSSA